MLKTIRPYIGYRPLLYFFSFVAGWPCVFYLLGWLPDFKINYVVLLALVSISAFADGKKRLPQSVQGLIIIQMAFWLFYFLIHADTSYITRIFYLAITLSLLLMQQKDNNRLFINIFVGWLTIQSVAGMIGFVLTIPGILTPISEFREFDGYPGYFFGLYTTKVYYGGFVRVAGFFDEPGAFAFWGIYALIYNKLFINDSRIERVLVFCLLCTLSMAYFIQLAVYAFFFYRKHRTKIFVAAMFLVVVMKIVAMQDPIFEEAIFGRFEYNKDTGTLSGDNRSDLASYCWNIFLSSPIIGVGATNLAQGDEFAGANPFTFFAADGLVGQIVAWLPFFYLWTLSKYDKRLRYVFFILFVGFMQRPYDGCQLLYPLINYSMILFVYNELKNKGALPCRRTIDLA